MDYVSLHNHSHYSILDALPSPKELILRAKELGQSAIALTDHGSFAGMWDAYKAARSAGIKLIVGAEFNFLADASRKDEKIRHVILLAQNAAGYKNLLSLNRVGFDQAITTTKKVIPIIDWKTIAEYSGGVTCLTACANGILGQILNLKNFEAAETDAKRLIDIFGKDNLGIEVQSHNLNRPGNAYFTPANQIFTNYHLIKLAQKLSLRVVPTCNTHYLRKEDAEIHDVLLAIGAMQPVYSNARLRYNVSDLYLKSAEEIQAFFARNNGEEFARSICENTLYFAQKSEDPAWVDPKFSNPLGRELPVFDVRSSEDYDSFQNWWQKQNSDIRSLAEDSAYLRFKCFDVFECKIKNKISLLKHKEYINRIETELAVLNKQGFSSYMLIVADYINWAKKNNISVGLGRGSVGGSILGYLLGIHAADPIKYGLIFERFQNIERILLPDVDADFETAGREKVINYIIQKYGPDHVAFVSNLSRITPKVYARDLARSLEFGGSRKGAVDVGDAIADTISKEVKNSSSFEELKTAPLFMEYVKRYPELAKHAPILGKIRNFSTHAAAVIIGSRSLQGLVPLRKDKDNNQAIEYEKNNAEDNGLLKADILGLSTLDLIRKTLELINKDGQKLCLEDIDFESQDKKTYDLISSGDTFGVFQFGTSGGTIDLCKKIKPRSIEDLAIITTLARPAAAAIREEFIQARLKKNQGDLPHPSLKEAFERTHGFALYDESMLQLGRDVAGWTLNESDRLRKMIKDKGKNPEKDRKLKEDFINNTTKHIQVSREMATHIWEKYVGSMSSYTFNKSHAILYSFISFITAYLKAHYPIEFLLANLMSEVRSNAPDAEANVDRAKIELRRHKVNILPPDINRSQMEYQLLDRKTLLTGLDALKFVGMDAIEEILQKRPFHSFTDFMLKVETRKVRSSAIQALAAAGCMDSFGISRKLIYLYCSDFRKKLQVWLKKHDPTTEEFVFPWPEMQEWSQPELFALEKNYLGESFVCSKKEAFGKFFKDEHANMSTIKLSRNKTYLPSIKAEIKSIFELKVKKEGSRLLGQEMAKITLEDEFGIQCSMTAFPEKWSELKQSLKEKKNKIFFEPGSAIHFSGSCNKYENEMGVIFDQLIDSVPAPQLPRDLKSKKITTKYAKGAVESSQPSSDLEQELEDQLWTEGAVELDEIYAP